MQFDLLREVATRRRAGLNSDLHVHEPKATSKRSTFVANYTLDRTGWPASCARSSIEVASVTGRERGNELEDKRFCPVGRQGRETADPDYLKRLSTRHRSGTMNDSF
jgi:hypothetical protein